MSLFALTLGFALAAEQLSEVPSADLRWSPDTNTTYRYEVESDLTWSVNGARDFDRATSVSMDHFRPRLPALHFDLELTVDCSFDAVQAGRFLATCDVAEVHLDSRQTDQRRLPDVLLALEDRIVDSRITTVVSERGRTGSVDVAWRSGSGGWDHVAYELVDRAVAGFQLELPSNPKADRWSESQSALAASATGSGPLAQSEIVHERRGGTAEAVLILSSGRLAHMALEAGLRPGEVGQARVRSAASFDGASGMLTERVWTVENVESSPFVQQGSLRLLAPQ